MDSIKNVVSDLMQHFQNANKNTSALPAIEEALKKILTKRQLRHIRVNYFHKGILALNVDSSAELYELGLKKAQLVESLRGELSCVKDLRLSLGEAK